MHTFTLSVAQSSLPWWLWNHSERQPLQNVMSQATWAPTSAVRCWNNGRTCSAALCPWNPLHLFWQFQLMLKWNGIFLMKFIAMVHLLFNMFSVPSALLCIITGTLSVSQEIPNLHSTCSFTDSCSKRCHVHCCFFYPPAAIVTAYETNTQHDPNNNNAMLGVHASASAIIQYGKIARKQVLSGITFICIDRNLSWKVINDFVVVVVYFLNLFIHFFLIWIL